MSQLSTYKRLIGNKLEFQIKIPYTNSMKIEINENIINNIIERINDVGYDVKPEGKVLEEMITEFINITLKENLDETWG